jgi:hypothetical protein
MKIHVRDIPDEANEKRKALGLTWREVINRGLQSKEPTPPIQSDPALETYLRSAIKSLSDMWDLLKKS